MNLKEDDNIILVLGNTKNGKSTILNILNETPLVIAEHDGKYTIEKKNKSDKNLEISSNDYSSGTKLPSAIRVQNNVYVDTPGFLDSEINDRTINKYFIHQLLSKSSKCKIMLVLAPSDFSTAGYQIRQQLSILKTTIFEETIKKGPIDQNNLLILVNKCHPENRRKDSKKI